MLILYCRGEYAALADHAVIAVVMAAGGVLAEGDFVELDLYSDCLFH